MPGDLCRRRRLLLHPLHHGGVPAYSPGASLGSLSDQVTLIVPVVLVSRLAGPRHPARPDPPLVAPRDHRHLRPLPRHLGLDLLARPEVH